MYRSNTALKEITKPQMRHIYAMAREVGFDNDTLHGIVYSLTRKEHIGELTVDEANTIIDRLKGNMKGFDRFKSKKPESEAQRVGMASEPQIKKIYRLMYELKNYDNPGEITAPIKKRLRGILKKYQKIDDIKFLTAAEAWKVIEELKKIIANEEMKRNSI